MDIDDFIKFDLTGCWPWRSRTSMDVEEFIKKVKTSFIDVTIYKVNDDQYYIPFIQTQADYKQIFEKYYVAYIDLLPFDAYVFDKKGIKKIKEFFYDFSIPYAEIPLKGFNVDVFNLRHTSENNP